MMTARCSARPTSLCWKSSGSCCRVGAPALRYREGERVADLNILRDSFTTSGLGQSANRIAHRPPVGAPPESIMSDSFSLGVNRVGQQMKATILAAVCATLLCGLTALSSMHISRTSSDQEPSIVTYQEPDDPIDQVLAIARSRIRLAENNEETIIHSLHDLDRMIRVKTNDPRIHWFRGLMLRRLNRNVEARVARDEAIRLARPLAWR